MKSNALQPTNDPSRSSPQRAVVAAPLACELAQGGARRSSVAGAAVPPSNQARLRQLAAAGRLQRKEATGGCGSPRGAACGNSHSGERAAEAEQHAEALSDRVFQCPPVASSLSAIGAKAGVGTLGATKIDQASQLLCVPLLTANAAAGNCSVTSKPVSLSITSMFAPKGPPVDMGITKKVSKCGNKDVPIFMEITSATEAKAKAAEQEHCDDTNIAFQRSLVPCSSALQSLNGTTVPGKDENECFRAVVAKLGFDPIDCSLEFDTLAKKTGERDSKGFHDFDPVIKSEECDKVVITNTPSSTNRIGNPAVAPPTFIPASTKCGAPAPAPAPSGSGPKAPPGGSPAPKSPGGPPPDEKKPKPQAEGLDEMEPSP